MERHIPWDLLIAHLKKEADEEAEEALLIWRTQADNHILYNEIASLWEEIIKESAAYNPDTDYYWKQLEMRMEAMEKKRRTLSIPLRNIRIAMAAASVLLLVAISSSYFITKKYFQPAVSLQTYKALNGKSQMILPDGSVVWLNVGSTLTYETAFLKNRRIDLEGQALFEVERDEKHPFVVSTGDVTVEVLGTRFHVEAYPTDEEIRVALLEGRVEVSAFEQAFVMDPGEVVAFDRHSRSLSKIEGDVVFESFWADDSYTFDAKPLSYICRYLERWFNIDIELDPAIADSQVYTFTITDEPLETILQIMSRINPIQYSFEDDKRVFIKNVSPVKK
ncbi:transmembrane sensor [Parabacteroides sp. PFB2-12]|uniref:FecR family protein n=1 Tax=unclassified Parabacteroides TaxID=2649774 RepID=UPI002476A7CE|nr:MULTISPECIES: FecR domain-containing protein [unclassified Parabacteroides]MDH6342589.1 transmembrane sensor [Parabacteroides sp. PM6-13]MDH6390241.1 transmembrane sensor [Parabacteroides sp. PFB2-12]